MIWKEVVVADSRYNPGMSIDELRKTTKNLIQGSRCPGRD
jgi:hypothetical protein